MSTNTPPPHGLGMGGMRDLKACDSSPAASTLPSPDEETSSISSETHAGQTSEGFISGFFSDRDGFVIDDTQDTINQFHALADHMGWSAQATEAAHMHLQDALVLQFNSMFGTDEMDLNAWQSIFQAMHFCPVPQSVESCKDHIRRFHFNLVDLVDASLRGSAVPLFRGHSASFMYTLRSGKYFPTNNAYAGHLLKEVISLSSDNQTRDSPIHAFFAIYDDFAYDQEQDTMAQFQALSTRMGWSDQQRQEAFTALQDALAQQFDDIYGTDETDVYCWQGLCQTLEVWPIPADITSCKQQVSSRNFTLWDVVDAGWTGCIVTCAPNRPSLLRYMASTSKYPPSDSKSVKGFLKAVMALCRGRASLKGTESGVGLANTDQSAEARQTPKKKPIKHSFITAYFSRFPRFEYRDADETMSQFSDLQETCRWDRQQYREEKKALQLALVRQFNQIYSKKAESMYGWQELCRVMNLSPVPSTVSECMLMFDHTHVNIVDLIDCHRTKQNVDTFDNVVDLSEYTVDTGKFFPKEHAKAGGVLQRLLREIMYYGTNYRDAPMEVRQGCQS